MMREGDTDNSDDNIRLEIVCFYSRNVRPASRRASNKIGNRTTTVVSDSDGSTW